MFKHQPPPLLARHGRWGESTGYAQCPIAGRALHTNTACGSVLRRRQQRRRLPLGALLLLTAVGLTLGLALLGYVWAPEPQAVQVRLPLFPCTDGAGQHQTFLNLWHGCAGAE